MAANPQTIELHTPRWRGMATLLSVMALAIGFATMFVRGAWINWPDAVESLNPVSGRVAAVMPFARPKADGQGRGWQVVVEGQTAAPLEIAYGRLAEAEIKALPGRTIAALVGGERYLYRRQIFDLSADGRKLLSLATERSLNKRQAGFQIVFGSILGLFLLCLVIYEFQVMTGRTKRWTS